MLPLLLGCAEDPFPEAAWLARAGYRLHRAPAEDEERVGLTDAPGLEGISCWRVEREGAAPARVCSYDFADWRQATWWDGGPRVRPGSMVYGLVRGDRSIFVRSPNREEALALYQVIVSWDEPAW